jgi:hypothetical protein
LVEFKPGHGFEHKVLYCDMQPTLKSFLSMQMQTFP